MAFLMPCLRWVTFLFSSLISKSLYVTGLIWSIIAPTVTFCLVWGNFVWLDTTVFAFSKHIAHVLSKTEAALWCVWLGIWKSQQMCACQGIFLHTLPCLLWVLRKLISKLLKLPVCGVVLYHTVGTLAKERLNKHRHGGTYPSLREPPKAETSPLHITCNT